MYRKLIEEDRAIARLVRANDRVLRGKEVRLISADNDQLGVVSFDEALRIAEEKGEDLVEVAPKANPPVCRVMNYGKFIYMEQKKQREAKKNQVQQRLKEIKFHPNIDEHDYQTKLNHAIAFLEKGNKVKFSIFLRGREMAHADLGMELLKRVCDETKNIATVDTTPRLSGRMLLLVLAPGAKK